MSKYRSLYSITFLLFIVLLESCNESPNITRKEIGNQIIEAHFKDDSTIEGEASYYSLSNVLIAKAHFVDGRKNGVAKSYYPSGKLKDSIFYRNDLLNGPEFTFLENGKLQWRQNSYYGISAGDNVLYNEGLPRSYYFDGFERKHLVNCNYDGEGKPMRLYFNASTATSPIQLPNGDSAIAAMFYFPHPPTFKTYYKLDIVDQKNITKQEINLQSDRMFLDTILQPLAPGLNYYFIADYKSAIDDSTYRVYSQKLR